MHRVDIRKGRMIVLLAMLLLITGSVFGVRAAGGTLKVGMGAPKVLDPALGANDPEVLFNRSIYDYLVDVLPDRSVAPNLAKEWKISDDSLTYTFTLQDGVKFQDGSDFSSADVVFSFQRLVTVKSPALNLLGDFTVSAPDAKTVVFTLKAPNADFLYGIGNQLSLIIKNGTEKPNELATGDKPYANFNGTGPFILTDYKDGQGATLTKNPTYWKAGQPLLDSIEFKFIDDPVTQVNALKSGDVDFIFKISPDQVSGLDGADGITLIQTVTNQHPVIRLRTDEGPGKDVKVRQAFKYATDRDELNQLVLEGRGTIGNNDPIGPGYAAFFDKDIKVQAYDPEKAKSLLAEAGYPDGLKVTLQTINTLGYDTLATVLQQQWAKAGITADIQVNEEGFYYDDSNPNNWLKADLGITGWGDRPVPQGYLAQAYATGASYNETHWSDPDLDKLIQEASVTTDETARAAIYHKISDIFNEDGPIIIPWFAPVFSATSAKVTGVTVAPFPGLTDLRGVSVG
ncbi:MAG: ABC transporter substrate-binding protein [Anaerolineae bacterium]|nr:ABC transporter substrate-binding protein [Anaerolineae bacterium]